MFNVPSFNNLDQAGTVWLGFYSSREKAGMWVNKKKKCIMHLYIKNIFQVNNIFIK